METARDKRTNLWAALRHPKGGGIALGDLSRANCRFPCNQRQQLVVEMKLAAQKPQSFGHNTQGEERRRNTTIHALAHPQHEHLAVVA